MKNSKIHNSSDCPATVAREEAVLKRMLATPPSPRKPKAPAQGEENEKRKTLGRNESR